MKKDAEIVPLFARHAMRGAAARVRRRVKLEEIEEKAGEARAAKIINWLSKNVCCPGHAIDALHRVTGAMCLRVGMDANEACAGLRAAIDRMGEPS